MRTVFANMYLLCTVDWLINDGACESVRHVIRHDYIKPIAPYKIANDSVSLLLFVSTETISNVLFIYLHLYTFRDECICIKLWWSVEPERKSLSLCPFLGRSLFFLYTMFIDEIQQQPQIDQISIIFWYAYSTIRLWVLMWDDAFPEHHDIKMISKGFGGRETETITYKLAQEHWFATCFNWNRRFLFLFFCCRFLFACTFLWDKTFIEIRSLLHTSPYKYEEFLNIGHLVFVSRYWYSSTFFFVKTPTYLFVKWFFFIIDIFSRSHFY